MLRALKLSQGAVVLFRNSEKNMLLQAKFH